MIVKQYSSIYEINNENSELNAETSEMSNIPGMQKENVFFFDSFLNIWGKPNKIMNYL